LQNYEIGSTIYLPETNLFHNMNIIGEVFDKEIPSDCIIERETADSKSNSTYYKNSKDLFTSMSNEFNLSGKLLGAG